MAEWALEQKLGLDGVGEWSGYHFDYYVWLLHPALKREDRLRKHPFAGFGTVMEDIKRTSYTKNQPILLGAF